MLITRKMIPVNVAASVMTGVEEVVADSKATVVVLAVLLVVTGSPLNVLQVHVHQAPDPTVAPPAAETVAMTVVAVARHVETVIAADLAMIAALALNMTKVLVPSLASASLLSRKPRPPKPWRP